MPITPLTPEPSSRLRDWLDRWGGVLPLLVAEFVVWLGFGGLLPVLPIYFTEQGIDLVVGLVIGGSRLGTMPANSVSAPAS